jgi:transposase-like protein
MARSKRPREGQPEPELPPEALDALIGGARTPEELEARFRQMKKRIVERMLGAELTHHLGYAPGEAKPPGLANHRNGSTPKTVLTDDGSLPLDIPRDRAGTFAPQLVPKGVRRLPGFDAKVLSLYARGMTVREIQGHLEELYQIEIAPDVISTVTDAVLEEVTAWQQRPLERVYPVVILDALRVKIRDEGIVRNKAVYLALGINREGVKDVLGLWIEQTEGAAFWLRIMTELKSRGVEDILIALIDGLAGFPEAISAVFPQAQIHHCTVHLVRGSLNYVSFKNRREVARELREIYRAPTEAAALAALEEFARGPWGEQYPPIVTMWRRHWEHIRPVFAYPPVVRQMLYTTNAIESLHMQLRKIVKTRGHFPSDEAATKLLYLALRNIIAKWTASSSAWRVALPHLAVLFGDRFIEEQT